MKQDDKKAPASVEGLKLASIFLKTIAKTTAIVFVPTLGLFGVGLIIDLVFNIMPMGELIGTALGLIIAAVLVYRQIKWLKKGEKQ
jgi:F0F1-type ATP synthase assembly protein I